MKKTILVPVSALRRALSMAEEMSYCTDYMLMDDENTPVGRDPKVIADLDKVRDFLRAHTRRRK